MKSTFLSRYNATFMDGENANFMSDLAMGEPEIKIIDLLVSDSLPFWNPIVFTL